MRLYLTLLTLKISQLKQFWLLLLLFKEFLEVLTSKIEVFLLDSQDMFILG